MLNYIIVCLSLIFVVVYSINKISKAYIQCKYTFTQTIELFDYFLSKAYETLYENDLIIHITNNAKLTPEERETYERNYVKRCMLYMGKNNLKLFQKFFGDEETMIVNMIRYMRKRINEDGLSKILDEQSKNLI